MFRRSPRVELRQASFVSNGSRCVVRVRVLTEIKLPTIEATVAEQNASRIED